MAPKPKTLETVVLRDLSGGLNTRDSELNLKPKYATRLENMLVADDGSVSLRGGTIVFSRLKDNDVLPSSPVEMFYFQTRLVVIGADGKIASVAADGTTTRIWDDDFAAQLQGAPPGWSATSIVDSEEFAGKLILCNGVDKPLSVDFDRTPIVTYLVDEGTGTNANTPIAKHVTSVSGFVVMAGNLLDPNIIDISNRYTAGTFYGDPAPNNAVQIDVSTIKPSSAGEMVSVKRYKNLLAIYFQHAIMLIQLGIFDNAGNHTPNTDLDVIEGHGALSHRCILSVGEDIISTDLAGVSSIKRSRAASNVFSPVRISEIIQPTIQKRLRNLHTIAAFEQIFAVRDPNNGSYIVFIPNHESVGRAITEDSLVTQTGSKNVLLAANGHAFRDGDKFTLSGVDSFSGIDAAELNKEHTVKFVIDDNLIIFEVDNAAQEGMSNGGPNVIITPKFTETIGFSFRVPADAPIQAAQFFGWKWTCGTSTVLNNIFFADEDGIIYLYNNGVSTHASCGDFLGKHDGVWANDTNYDVGIRALDEVEGVVWRCLIAHRSAATGTFEDDRWLKRDFWYRCGGYPINFVDETPWRDFGDRGIIKRVRHIGIDSTGTATFTVSGYTNQQTRDPLTGEDKPAVSVQLRGGSALAYGSAQSPYGDGVITSDNRLTPFPMRGKLVKLRLSGSTTEPLRISAVLLTFARGNIYA